MAGAPVPFVSQAKIFIDMPGPRGAAKQLLTVKKFDAKPGGSTKVVTTIGVDDGAGWQTQQGGWDISMTCIRTAGQLPEVDWDFANRTRKIFTITTEDEDSGKVESFTCRVSKVDSSKDDQGTHEDSVELAAIQKY